MLERLNPVLRVVCLVLAGFLTYQVLGLVRRKNPLKNMSFAVTSCSAVPTASAENNTTNSARTREPIKGMTDLPPAVQASVERIKQSEILGAVVRPLPMALLGIAGNDALLRAPNGQTGLIKEGETLGGVKLLRIGTNRVLVEHEQQQKELTVFSGFGGETLLPQGQGDSK